MGEPVETCSLCEMDPELPENRGRQLYVCDACRELVCSVCSENATGNRVLCRDCADDRPEEVVHV